MRRRLQGRRGEEGLGAKAARCITSTWREREREREREKREREREKRERERESLVQ